MYNNSLYFIIEASLFYVVYRTNPEICLNVKDNILEERVVMAQERV